MKNINNQYETDDGQLIFLRHPETIYNVYKRSVPKNLIECFTDYIDCCLSEKGNKQIEKLKDKLKSYKIKYIFTCPLFRCLQTCELVFKDHPDRENIKVIINPWIISKIHSLDDFSINIHTKQKNFSTNSSSKIKYDWDFFNSLYTTEDEREFFYLNMIDDLNNKEIEYVNKIEKIYKKFKEEYTSNVNQRLSNEFELMLKELAVFLAKTKSGESLNHVLKRCIKFKNHLKKYTIHLSENEKILIFTHSSFTKIFSSKSAYEMEYIADFPSDGTNISNCDILSMNI